MQWGELWPPGSPLKAWGGWQTQQLHRGHAGLGCSSLVQCLAWDNLYFLISQASQRRKENSAIGGLCLLPKY